MPVFWLSLAARNITIGKEFSCWHNTSVWLIFLAFTIWHLFIYPASNAYNSYQDQDKGSIGDIETPLKASKDVFWISILFNLIGFALSLIINKSFAFFVLVYIITSQLYSWRKVRLKKYPIIGFLTVFIFQGAWILFSAGFLNECKIWDVGMFFTFALAASFLFGGGYPITQIYQHKQDREDGVKTISMLLGIRGTIIFSGIMNAIGMALLFYVLWQMNYLFLIAVYLFCMIPVLFKFNKWARAVFKDESEANFENVMRMTWLSGICNNIAFILFIILTYYIKA